MSGESEFLPRDANPLIVREFQINDISILVAISKIAQGLSSFFPILISPQPILP